MSRQQAIEHNIWTGRLRAAPGCLTKSVRCRQAPGLRCPTLVTRVGKMPLGRYLIEGEVISILAKNCVSRACEAALHNFPFSVQIDSICWYTVVLYLSERYMRELTASFPKSEYIATPESR